MTDHKQLKRRVRERAARTGESYTTARRHVLAAAARATAAETVAAETSSAFGGGQHQPSTLLRHLLSREGIQLSEAMACGLGGGIGFMAAVFEYRGLPPILTIVAQHHPDPWVPSALTRLGIGYEEEHGAAQPAMAALRAALRAGKPVYCVVSATRLPWRASEPYLDTDPHGVVVVAEREGVLLVEDEAVVPHEISLEAFASAWAAHRKGRHHRIVLRGAGTSGGGLVGAVKDAVAVTAGHLTGPVLGNAFDVNFGLSGMERLAGQLRDARTKGGFARRFAAPEALAFGMRRLYECLELRDTAPGGTRPLYADFLVEAAELAGIGRWAEAAELYREAGRHWSGVAALAAGALGEDFGEGVERQLLARLCGIREEGPAAVGVELGEAERRELFDALADGVDAARRVETEAVALLAA
ncbi:BtrH N-terminal domain-containing protein [Dactylosporangium sp. CS-033363]|uniref:BtrH N-terminal domain-containing protein n=1 Tax=Dactylosporangium sp. CS-033363 TaxID=3239935 RepID=UPI003D8A3F9A